MNSVNLRCLVDPGYKRWSALKDLNSGKKRQRTWVVKLYVWAWVTFCILGCATSSTNRPRPLNIETVLVLPFSMATQRYETGSTVRCLECDVMVETGAIEVGAADFMNRKLIAFLKKKTPYTAIPLWTVEGISTKNLSQSLRGSERRLLVQMGKSLNADAILGGTIYRFRQRVGTGISMSTPASVAFAMELIRVDDGRVIWNRAFDQTQHSLDKDLFKIRTFLKRGVKWLTAEELAASGLHEIMASFPLP